MLENAERLLIPGGQLLLDLADPASLMLPRERWWSELDGGYMLMEAWYDPSTCVHEGTFRYFDRDGNLNVSPEPERIRVYSLPELDRIIAKRGPATTRRLRREVASAPALWRDHHERMIVIGRKPYPEFDEAHER